MLDEPLFSSENTVDQSVPQSNNVLAAEELRKRADIVFHDKVLNFGFVSIIAVLVLVFILICADFYAQGKGYDSSMIKECLSLLTYIATAALGFIFGASSK